MAEVRPIIPAGSPYTRTAIALHWLTLFLIASGFALGRWMVDLPLAPRTLAIYSYHKWIGITVFLVTLVRLLWRFAHPMPPLATMSRWRRRVATASHVLLYLLLFAIPISGWMYSSATGVQVVYLGQVPLPDLVPKDRTLAATLKSVHYALNFALVGLVLVHMGAALWHRHVDRDLAFWRMLPTGPRPDKESAP
jgi:cytochrome b561